VFPRYAQLVREAVDVCHAVSKLRVDFRPRGSLRQVLNGCEHVFHKLFMGAIRHAWALG
jgi:hypothetical protein